MALMMGEVVLPLGGQGLSGTRHTAAMSVVSRRMTPLAPSMGPVSNGSGHGVSGVAPPEDAQQLAAWQQVLDSAETEIRNQASENEFLRSKVRVMEWQLQNGAVDGELDAESQDSQHSTALGPQAELGGGEGGGYAARHGPARPRPPRSDHDPAPVSRPHPHPHPHAGHGAQVPGRPGAVPEAGQPGAAWHPEPSPPATPGSTTTSHARRGGEMVEAGGQRQWPLQDVLVSSGRIGWLEDQLHVRDRMLAAAHVKEAQLLSEKRTLERRVAELRMAYDAQQQGMLEATSKALAYRKEVLDDNMRLSQALERAEHDRTVFVASLMPMIAEFGLHPHGDDAQEMVHAVKMVVQRLLASISMERRLPPGPWAGTDAMPLLHGFFQPPAAAAGAQGPLRASAAPAVPDQTSQQPTAGPPEWNAAPAAGGGTALADGMGLEGGMGRLGLGAAGQQQPPPPPQAAWAAPDGSLSRPPPGRGTPWTEFVRTVQVGEEPAEWQSPSEGQWQQPPAATSEGTYNPSPSPSPPPPEARDGEGAQQALAVEQSGGAQADRDRGGAAAGSRGEGEGEGEGEAGLPEMPAPAIEGLRIVGDPVLGGKLTACGHSINGTALCVFQWVRQYADGSADYIEGAASPEYTITADDCGAIVAIECVPMDDQGSRGELVRVAANDGHFIQPDGMMQEKLNECRADGTTAFDVWLQEGFNGEEGYDTHASPCLLQLKRSEFTLKRASKKFFRGSFAEDVRVDISVAYPTAMIVSMGDGRQFFLDLRDSRTRDMAVLVMRQFKETHDRTPSGRKSRGWFK